MDEVERQRAKEERERAAEERAQELRNAITQLHFAESRAYRMFVRLYDVLHRDTDHPTNDVGLTAGLLTVAAMVKDTEKGEV